MKIFSMEKLSAEELAALPKKERIAYKKRRRTFKRIRALAVLDVLIIIIALGVTSCVKGHGKGEKLPESDPNQDIQEEVVTSAAIDFTKTAATKDITVDIGSQYAILVNADSKEITAVKGDIDKRIYPASMTKVLSLLVASETITDWTKSVYMTRDIEEYCYVNECSNVGYSRDEIMALSELPYGTILTSGADATLGMALYAVDPAGTSGKSFEELHKAYADLMNKKVKDLGLKSTHFTNAVGIHAEDHYTTTKEMALIMYAAMADDFSRKILTTPGFETAPTEQHPQGQVLTNLFIRKISSKDCGNANVIAAKTGYVEEAGFCAVSYATASDGTGYICVTASGTGTNNSISDHAAIYKAYVK